MKNILIFSICLIGLSGCIKLQDSSLCGNNLISPALAYNTLSMTTSQNNLDSFSNRITAPQPGYTYSWLSPAGQKYSGTNLHFSNYGSSSYYGWGTWSVVANTGYCSSDTSKFTVSYPSCIGSDSISLSSLPAYKMSYYSTYINTYNYYEYQFRAVGNSNISCNIYFYTSYSTPPSGLYTVNSQGPNSLYTGQCYITFTTTTNSYESYTGTVYITTVGNTYYINFCSLVFYDPYNFTYPTASGNMHN